MSRNRNRTHVRKSRTSKWPIPIAVVAIVAVIAVVAWGQKWLTSTPNPTPNPTPTPTPTPSPTPSPTPTPTPSTIVATQVVGRIQGSKIIVSESDLNKYGLLFVDAQLQSPTSTVVYGNREIPLYDYREGSAIPLVIYRTTLGEPRAAIRVCEPCLSWSVHIDAGNIVCDKCGTRWTVNELRGVSGGCTRYPPISMPTTSSNGEIAVDLSSLNVPLLS